jgi:uncharacterized membrane protein YhdT
MNASQPIVLVVAVAMLALALYSHYTLYATMYSLPEWFGLVCLGVAVLMVVGAVGYVLTQR